MDTSSIYKYHQIQIVYNNSEFFELHLEIS